MKKIILSAAIVLGSLSTFTVHAQSQNSIHKEHIVPVGYTEIKVVELPTAVIQALKKSYPDAVLTKVYINEKKEYKLEISVKDQKATVYTDVDGNWLKK